MSQNLIAEDDQEAVAKVDTGPGSQDYDRDVEEEADRIEEEAEEEDKEEEEEAQAPEVLQNPPDYVAVGDDNEWRQQNELVQMEKERQDGGRLTHCDIVVLVVMATMLLSLSWR